MCSKFCPSGADATCWKAKLNTIFGECLEIQPFTMDALYISNPLIADNRRPSKNTLQPVRLTPWRIGFWRHGGHSWTWGHPGIKIAHRSDEHQRSGEVENKSSKMPTIAFNSLRLRSIRCLNRKCWLRVLQLDFNTFWGWRYCYCWHRQLGWSQVCRWSRWRPKPTKQEEPKGKWDQWKHTILGCCLDKEFQGSNSESEFAVLLEH